MEKYRIELVWNREFNWAKFGNGYDDLKTAKATAESIRDSGDGARVKKVRVVENENDKVVWNG